MADTYQALGTYNDAAMSDEDRKKLEGYKQQWGYYNSQGDTANAAAQHDYAEQLRSTYGYSGGMDGSQYFATNSNTPTKAAAYTPPKLPSATSQASSINSLYDKQYEQALAALTGAYNQNVLGVDAAAAKIPGIYQDARNQTQASADTSRQQFNEYAAAAGLNSGAGGQAQLAMGSALQSNLGGINRGESDALRDVEMERLRLQTAYQDAIAEAKATGDLARAQALYEEAARVDASLVETARAQAGLSYQAYAANNANERDYINDQRYADETKYNRDRYADETAYNRERYADETAYNRGIDQRDFDLKVSQLSYENKLEIAKILSQYGIFSGFGDLDAYSQSPEVLDQMLRYAALSDPFVAYLVGGYGVGGYDSGYGGGGYSSGGGGYSGGGGGGYANTPVNNTPTTYYVPSLGNLSEKELSSYLNAGLVKVIGTDGKGNPTKFDVVRRSGATI